MWFLLAGAAERSPLFSKNNFRKQRKLMIEVLTGICCHSPSCIFPRAQAHRALHLWFPRDLSRTMPLLVITCFTLVDRCIFPAVRGLGHRAPKPSDVRCENSEQFFSLTHASARYSSACMSRWLAGNEIIVHTLKHLDYLAQA